MKTFIELLKEGVEGYKLRDILDNIDEQEFENTAKEYAEQFSNQVETLVMQNLPSQNGLLAEIRDAINGLPENWEWKKCYEIGNKKYWSLSNLPEDGLVSSFRLLLHFSDDIKKKDIQEDQTLKFIENSLKYVTLLLEMIKSKQTA